MYIFTHPHFLTELHQLYECILHTVVYACAHSHTHTHTLFSPPLHLLDYTPKSLRWQAKRSKWDTRFTLIRSRGWLVHTPTHLHAHTHPCTYPSHVYRCVHTHMKPSPYVLIPHMSTQNVYASTSACVHTYTLFVYSHPLLSKHRHKTNSQTFSRPWSASGRVIVTEKIMNYDKST